MDNTLMNRRINSCYDFGGNLSNLRMKVKFTLAIQPLCNTAYGFGRIPIASSGHLFQKPKIMVSNEIFRK